MDNLLNLLTITDEESLKRFCRELVITNPDLGKWIANAKSQEHGCKYERLEALRMPDHLNPTPTQMAAFIDQISNLKPGMQVPLEGKAINVFSKIQQLSEERRARLGHLFYSENKQAWCLIYMTQRDTQVFDQHWEYGPHVHILTGAYEKFTPDELARVFTNNEKMPDGIHVRFYDPEWGPEWQAKWGPDVRP